MRLFSSRNPAVKIRGIHFDLKGLPPAPSRFVELLDILAAARINCVLVEWEDQYPWWTHPDIRNESAYSEKCVREFLARAKALKIEVIPLVQCYGHLENVLRKPRFIGMRELPDHPADLCPFNPDSQKLIITLIDDVLRTHEGKIKRFHLGGDEARTLGSCPKCKAFIEKRGKAALYLRHVGPLLDHLRERGLRPILWDDMMREWPMKALRELSARAELMCWSYGAEPFRWLKREYLGRFAKAGVTLWGASAFKGGDGPCRDVPDLRNRAANEVAWAREAQKRKMEGVIATGWSRYSTFTAPCEGIEASLDSLVLAGAAMWDGMLPKDAVDQAHRLLCTGKLKRIAGDRFLRCLEASQKMEKWKQEFAARMESYQAMAFIVGESDRANVEWAHRAFARMEQWMHQGEEIACEWIAAHKGLVPDIWLERCAESRQIVLRKITKMLVAEGRAKTPER